MLIKIKYRGYYEYRKKAQRDLILLAILEMKGHRS
jgi:hypothetical protein